MLRWVFSPLISRYRAAASWILTLYLTKSSWVIYHCATSTGHLGSLVEVLKKWMFEVKKCIDKFSVWVFLCLLTTIWVVCVKILFASDSNSGSTRSNQISLIHLENLRTQLIVMFSSCCIKNWSVLRKKSFKNNLIWKEQTHTHTKPILVLNIFCIPLPVWLHWARVGNFGYFEGAGEFARNKLLPWNGNKLGNL